MSARKIRMTSVGLIAMPADRDEAHVSADDIPSDPELRTAWADVCALAAAAVDRGAAVEAAWNAALTAAADNDLAALRSALARARDAATAAGLPTDHEDAALAMLPGGYLVSQAQWRPADGYKLRRDAGPFAVVIEPAAVGWRGILHLEGNAQHAASISLGFYSDLDNAKEKAPKDAAGVLREALVALGDAS